MSANEEVRGGKTGGDDFTGSLADVTDSGVFLQSAVSLLLASSPSSPSQQVTAAGDFLTCKLGRTLSRLHRRRVLFKLLRYQRDLRFLFEIHIAHVDYSIKNELLCYKSLFLI